MLIQNARTVVSGVFGSGISGGGKISGYLVLTGVEIIRDQFSKIFRVANRLAHHHYFLTNMLTFINQFKLPLKSVSK